MSLTVHIPSALREHTRGAARVEVPHEGDTVASALEVLYAAYPGIRDRLVTEQGNLRPHVSLFVGADSIRYTGGFDTRVRDGDELTILPAVSGG